MSAHELLKQYNGLRLALEAAYAQAQWDAPLIDRITEQMVPLERALSSTGHAWDRDTEAP